MTRLLRESRCNLLVSDTGCVPGQTLPLLHSPRPEHVVQKFDVGFDGARQECVGARVEGFKAHVYFGIRLRSDQQSCHTALGGGCARPRVLILCRV